MENNKEEMLDKAPEEQKQEEQVQENQLEEQKDKYEKESYSSYTYLKVQKWRERGKMYGVQVPYLTCPLTKPEKKRKKYVVFATILFVIAGVMAALALFLAISTLPAVIGNASDIGGPSWDVLHIAEALKGTAVWLAILLLVGLLVAVGFAAVAPLMLGIQCLHLTIATKEEIAYGPTLNKLLWVMGGITLVLLIVPIVMIVLWPLWFFAIAFGAVTWLVIQDKLNAIKWFKTLPEENQKSYREHARALARVKSRKEARDRMNTSLFWR